uniref:Uncharacterized protein n=1 Tax=Romanomermis culicivorax TaxID=13658 RepID=A0A915KYF5_ROMCU
MDVMAMKQGVGRTARIIQGMVNGCLKVDYTKLDGATSTQQLESDKTNDPNSPMDSMDTEST